MSDQPVAYRTLGALDTGAGVIIPNDVIVPAIPGVTNFPGMVAGQYKGRAYPLPDTHVVPIYEESAYDRAPD